MLGSTEFHVKCMLACVGFYTVLFGHFDSSCTLYFWVVKVMMGCVGIYWASCAVQFMLHEACVGFYGVLFGF